MYYQECKYTRNSGISCNYNNGGYEITLGDLVTYGYIKGNNSEEDNEYVIVNPNNGENIGNCLVRISYTDGNVLVEAISPAGSCPTEYR